MRTWSRGGRAAVALTLTALLLGCGQQQATAPSVDLSGINPALSTDPLSILFDPLRAELSQSFPPGADLTPGYASLDQRFRPAIRDAGAALLKAAGQYQPGPAGSGQPTPSPAAEQRTDVVLLASVTPGVEYVVNQAFDRGQEDAPGGWTLDITGVSQLYGGEAGVALHIDAAGDSTKSLAPNDFVVIDETNAADVKVDTCPDAAGLIHGTLKVNLSERVQVSGPGGRSRGERHYAMTADILGHVNDAAELTGYDLLHMTFQRVGTEVGATDSAAFLAVGYSFTGIDPAILPGSATGHLGADTSARVHTTSIDAATVGKEISALIFTAWSDAQPVVIVAEHSWRNGRCVALVATKGPDPKRLGPGQTSKFTVEVHHRPDGEKLDKPVVATPHGGQVDPAGRPVAPPSQFSFTAAGGKPQPYSVDLKSTSRRGIGKLTVTLSQIYQLTVTFVSGPSARGLPNTVPVTVTGTVSADPSGTGLSGSGELHAESYAGECKYDSGDVHLGWTDAGPLTLPVTLKATDKGDGTMELSIDTRGLLPLPSGTFPVAGGTVTHELTYNDCGPRSGTETIKAEPPSG